MGLEPCPIDFRFTLLKKSADQTVNNSTVLVDDTDLQCSLAANEIIVAEFYLFNNSAAAADMKIDLDFPAGCICNWGGDYINTAGGAIALGRQSAATDVAIYGAAAADYPVAHLTAMAINGGTAGTLKLRFAQQAADASDTKMLAGSSMLITRLA